jgi:hypothetical protein
MMSNKPGWTRLARNALGLAGLALLIASPAAAVQAQATGTVIIDSPDGSDLAFNLQAGVMSAWGLETRLLSAIFLARQSRPTKQANLYDNLDAYLPPPEAGGTPDGMIVVLSNQFVSVNLAVYATSSSQTRLQAGDGALMILAQFN